MVRSDLYLKVKLEYGEDEKPEKIADEICRRLLKLYGVRTAEISNLLIDPDGSR